MKQPFFCILFMFWVQLCFSQTYDNLQKLGAVSQNVYYSEDAKERALKIAENITNAEKYFQQQFDVKPNYTLLVLSPSDWKKYAHPQAIYGIPHFLPDGRLVIASENNDFWRRNTPPVDRLPKELGVQLKNTYTDKNGEINLTHFFDLLAVHELGHAFQNAARMTKQRNWLNEIFCNALLHTYMAEKNHKELPFLTVFPETSVAAFPPERLKYTTLEDFETNYNDLAKNHPDNYGWYQCQFHITARKIYDNAGVLAMKKMWNSLMDQKEKLNDEDLAKFLKQTHPALESAFINWNKH